MRSATFKVGSKVTYKCVSSEVTRDRMCLSSGEWSPVGFVCDVCPPGWQFQASSSTCYGYFNTSVPIDTARQSCTDLGAQLATARNQSENAIIQQLIENGDVWLPLSDVSAEGVWVWDEGDTASWLHWDENEPDNSGSKGEDCVVMRNNGKWDDVKCQRSKKAGYVCVKPHLDTGLCKDFWQACSDLFVSQPDMCSKHPAFAKRFCPFTCGVCEQGSTPMCTVEAPPGTGDTSSKPSAVFRGETVEFNCSDGYVAVSGNALRGCTASGELSGSPLRCVKGCPVGWKFSSVTAQCYKHFEDTVPYNTAVTRCTVLQGSLFMPKTAAIYTEVVQMFNIKHYVWIGLTDRQRDGEFVWGDGSKLVGWKGWGSGEPKMDVGYDCVHRGVKGNWQTNLCSRK